MLEYNFFVVVVLGLIFINNIFFKNNGLGVNYGVIIFCNGKVEMYGNVLENL